MAAPSAETGPNPCGLLHGQRIKSVHANGAHLPLNTPLNIHPLRGVLMVLGAAMLWGTTGTAQSLMPSTLSSLWVGALRLGVAALFFVIWVLVADRGVWTRQALRSPPWALVLTAAGCMCVYNLAFFAGVRLLGVAVGTAVAIGSGPIWAGLLQALWLRRWPSALWWGGTVLAVCGVVLLVTANASVSGLSMPGLLLCLLTGLSYAVYALVSKDLVASVPAGRATALVFVCAALMAMPLAAALAGLPTLQAGDVAVVAWLGIMSTGVAYLLLGFALRHIAGATAVSLALAEPVTAFVLAVVVIGEQPGPVALAGLMLVLAGLGLVIRTEVRGAGRA